MDKMTGNLIILRPPKEEDYEYFASLKNDLRTQAWNQRTPMRATFATTKAWLDKEYKQPNCATFTIETKEGKVVGHIGYHEGNRRINSSIGVITGVEHWGKGYCQEAHDLLLEFLFEERGLQRVSLSTQSEGERGIKAAEKMGSALRNQLSNVEGGHSE